MCGEDARHETEFFRQNDGVGRCAGRRALLRHDGPRPDHRRPPRPAVGGERLRAGGRSGAYHRPVAGGARPDGHENAGRVSPALCHRLRCRRLPEKGSGGAGRFLRQDAAGGGRLGRRYSDGREAVSHPLHRGAGHQPRPPGQPRRLRGESDAERRPAAPPHPRLPPDAGAGAAGQPLPHRCGAVLHGRGGRPRSAGGDTGKTGKNAGGIHRYEPGIGGGGPVAPAVLESFSQGSVYGAP